ncbi:MAG: S9 family peptidase [Armatimonadetes bacterium]|nr:S9 family peptidase [Armatimonadota bacterium]
MPEPQVAPYGSWKSPITPDLILAGTVGLSQVRLDGEDLYWIEGRPMEGGRQVIVHQPPGGERADLTPPPFNARTRVHEYGGGDYLAHRGTVYFSNFEDQRLYRIRPGESPSPLTPEGPFRFADAVMDETRERLICVREDHSSPGQEAVNTITAVPLDGGEPTILVSGSDFYAAPRLSPDGSRLAWLAWNHPNMPWDETELWVAKMDGDGILSDARRVAGGDEESVYAPHWSPDGALHFVSDRTGWWNLYCLGGGGVEPLCPKEAEFGEPAWVFGTSTYAFLSADRLLCTYQERGITRLAILDAASGELDDLLLPYSGFRSLQAGPERIYFIGSSPTRPSAVVEYSLITGETREIRRSSDLEIDPGYLTLPEAVEFPTTHGRSAYGYYYAPKNRDFIGPEGEKPPLVVMSHGGPTAAAGAGLNLGHQYFTSRGFAVLDVNYGGSTGYGRAYRERLKGLWGIVDVDDCANGALSLVERGEVDGDRLAIVGGSAGGYTTLAALAFRDVFKAGASHFGVSDLEALAQETHKFESRYLDGLIGPYPERRDLYIERSPIHHADRLSCPVIFFQGLEDAIVPPNQAERMVEALRRKGIPVAYVPFEGEQHGFRKAENIKRALEGELYFFSRIFKFDLADPVEPVPIDNLA